MTDPDTRFLDEAVSRGVLSADEAEDCLRILATLNEIDVDLDAGAVAERKGFLERAQVDEIRRALARFRVGKYEVLERLGEGGTGVVWRARDERLDRVVALKVLASALAGSAAYRERFEREARVAVTLNHVNIVRGLDYGEADGYHYFAMEFVAGETLRERVDRGGRLDEADALGILRQVVDALRYVRRFDLIHRDVKPENVLLTPAGQVKLGDLGLAKPSLEESARLRADDATAGTPLYMAPEQIRDPHRVDWRADAYSLGATLFHALTGRPPFAGGHGDSVVHRQLNEAPPDPRELVLSISQGAAAVTLQLLQKDPADRYASWEDLLADIDAVLDGRPPVHTLSFTSGRDRPLEVWRESVGGARAHTNWSPRKRFVAAAGLLTGTALAAWAGWTYLWPWTDPVPTRRPPVQTPRAADPGPARSPQVEKRSPEPSRPSLDEEKLARAALAAAEKAAAKHPDDVRACRRDYEFVTRHHPDTAAAAEATRRIEDLTAELESAANREYAARLATADRLVELGRTRDAWAELDGFPDALDGTVGAANAAAAAERLADVCARDVAAALKRAGEAAQSHRYDEAELLLQSARGIAVPDLRAEVYDATMRVREARQEFEARRERQRPLFVQTYQGLLELAVDAGVGTARIRVTTQLEKELEGLDGFEPELRALLDDLRALDRLTDQATRGWERLDEETRRELAGNSGTLESPLQLAGSALQVLALAGGAEADTGLQRDLFVHHLARGELRDAALVLSALERDERADHGAERRLEWVIEATRLNVEAAIRIARRSVDDGDLLGAASVLREARRRLPSDPRPRVALAGVLADLGQLKAAAKELEAALEIEGCSVDAYLDLARIERRLGHEDRSLARFLAFLDQAAPAHPGRKKAEAEHRILEDLVAARKARALVRRGDLRYRSRKDDDALEAYRGALAQVPGHPGALLGIGRVHLRGGRARSFEAFEALQRLVVAHPDAPQARDARRLIRDLLHDHGEATAAWEKTVNWGREALRQERYAEAVYHFEGAVRDSPLVAESYFGLGRAHFGVARGSDWNRHDLEQSERALRSLLLLDPEHAEGTVRLARTLLRLRRYEKALAAASRAFELDPAAADALLVQGWAHLRLDDEDAALRSFERSLAKEKSAEALLGKALALERQGSEGAARSVLQQLVEDVGVPDRLRAEVDDLKARLDPGR